MPALALALALAASAASAQPQPRAGAPRVGDYIVAVVNQELVTAGELQQRVARIQQESGRSGAKLPPPETLRQQVLDALIDERVQTTYARESGQKIEEGELDRAVANVAAQNQISMPELRERLRREGTDYGRFRNDVRQQMLVERVREREVQARIQITEREIDALLDKQRAEAGAATEYNVAQVLVTVPDGASDAVVAERRARADAALARVRSGEAFEQVARELSEDGNRATGGEIGLRPADRLPDVFVDVIRPLKAGELAPALLRSGAGFHVLKLLERRDGGVFAITQTRARHILLRPSAQLTQAAALRRLAEFKQQIAAGRSFEQLARDNSEDSSAAQGGDLGWASPGTFVPEFEEALNALAVGAIADPIVSRFGVHLIQVVERRKTSLDAKQQREQARNVLREQKFDEAYFEWARDLRARAYVEMREPPS